MEQNLRLEGLSCEACEKVIRKVAEKNNARLKSIDRSTGTVNLELDSNNLETIKSELTIRGFPEKGKGSRGEMKRVWRYIKLILSGDKETAVESKLLNYGLGSLIVLIVIGAFASTTLFGSSGKLWQYMPLVYLTMFTSIMTIVSYEHMLSYRKNLSCTNGMMVGMTSGMSAGFLFGALIGATNGMFVGSVAGMSAGMFIGAKLGKNSGVMGGLEGLMAGGMAGTMGAMISVMMINDHLIDFLHILFVSYAVIMGGLSYMMYREDGPAEHSDTVFLKVLYGAALLFLATLFIMVFGPKSPPIYP